MKPERSAIERLWTFVAILMTLPCLPSTAVAAPPDLINGGVPGDTITFNLGPTGARGWAHHVREDTSESRQILVAAVEAGSPAAGVLAPDDVILGADGTGAEPVNFTMDARKSLGLAIGAAEAQFSPPATSTLKLIRWRETATPQIETVDILLPAMGAYSATAPYNCTKSALILQQGLNYIMSQPVPDGPYKETAGRYSFGTLSLLAANNPSDPDNEARMARAQTEARALIPSAATMAQMMSDERDATSMVTWQRGHTLIVLTEYYLVTNDALVLPAIEAYAVNIARNQSLFGTLGHIFAEKNADGSDNGPMGGVYGPVNSTGLPCFLGLLLARECDLTQPVFQPTTEGYVEAAIERTSRFFAYYTGRGSIPYGEHEAFWQGHENNGKSGLSSLCFALQEDRVDEGGFFAKMAAASASQRGDGHTGAFANYVWAPLGAAAGGEAAAASHFSRISWMLDLNRRWDHGFDYDCLSGEGPNSGSQYNDFRMSTAALLTYALPLRQLHVTGRGHDAGRNLTPTDVTEAAAVDGYSAASRSTSELVGDLGSWSPLVQRRAAEQLATRTIDSTLLAQITGLATDPASTSRIGACFTLGKINNSATANARAATLAGLLEDSGNHVRFIAAEAMRYLPDSARLSQLSAILEATANTARPLLPFDEEDPLHFAHGRLALLLFYSGSAYGPKGVIYGSKINSPTVVDRNLLYPAIRAVAANPVGQARSTLGDTYKNLTAADVNALAGTLVESIHYRAPSDKMFSSGIRNGGLFALEKHDVAEGVPLAMAYMVDDGRGDAYTNALGVLEDYAGGGTTVQPDPDVIGFCKSLLGGDQAAAAQAVLDAIAAEADPAALTPFKSIASVTADAPSMNLPSKWTVLRVNATDLAEGDSIYTWRKVYGPGVVSFTPNGDGASRNTTVFLDGTPGRYLFEVKMSDTRGFTEVYDTVALTLNNPDGTLPPNNPPTADPQSLAVDQATPTPITLTGTDLEGYPLVYSVTSQPAHGTLSGTAPYFLYTSDFNYTGSDSFTFEVVDSEGQVSAATIGITVASASGIGLAIYEPFNYPAGPLAGKGGSSEVGLAGTWAANTSAKLVDGSLDFGLLPTLGGSIGNLNGGSNNYGGTRAVSASALAANGLLNDGATLWFSVVMGYGTNYSVDPPVAANRTNARLAFALSNSNFSTGNNQYFIVNEGTQTGSGLGVTLGRFDGANGKVVATQFRDSSFGTSSTSGNVFGTVPGSNIGANSQRLVVGKITWGSGSDTIELYEPDTDLNLGSATSSLTVNVDQSSYDAITWCRGDTVTMDEIRFGPTYHSVLFGSVAMTADTSPPTPSPVGFHAPPTPSGGSSVTMVAATAFDPAGVEYHFTCTAGGGHDSGWQDSPYYTDTGLTPGIPYDYTVKARDKSPARNETVASAAASTIIPTEATVPDVVGMPQTTAESIITLADMSAGGITFQSSPTVPAGEVIGQDPAGETTASLGTAVNLTVSSGPDISPPSIDATDMVDDKDGGPVARNTMVTYTVTFSEDMDADTVDDGDFGNAGSSAIAIGSITETAPGVFLVEATPTSPGVLQLEIVAGAVLSDTAGNSLDTAASITDDTSITVFDPDITPPAPDPMTFADAPVATGPASVSMTATTATDPSGVEYYFTCTSGGGHDSDWQDSPTYEDTGLVPSTQYAYTVMARDKSTNANATAPSLAAAAITGPPVFLEHAIADNAVSGSMIGTYAGTLASDNIFQELREVESSGNPSIRYSFLEHKWTFNVTGGDTVTFHIEAYHSANTEGDDFIFAYSTNGVDGTYQNMVTVTKTGDDNTPQIFTLPAGISGTVHVRVVDTDQTEGRSVLDSLFIDEMYFHSVSTNSTTVPDVVGLAQTSAEADIVAANLVVGAVTTQNDAAVPAGGVISQDPAGGTSATEGSVVGLVVSIGPVPDYQTWSAIYSPADLTNPDADLDGDGMNNNEERIWGLDPTSVASSNPIKIPLNPTTGTFTYTRRDDDLTAIAYTIWTSGNLRDWDLDEGAVQTPGESGPNGVQIVSVKLSPDLMTSQSLFVRVRAAD